MIIKQMEVFLPLNIEGKGPWEIKYLDVLGL